MKCPMSALQQIRVDEEGHAVAGLTTLAAAVGAVGLGVGAATGSDVAAVAGGIVLGLGLFAASFARHTGIDYDIFRRLEKLGK